MRAQWLGDRAVVVDGEGRAPAELAVLAEWLDQRLVGASARAGMTQVLVEADAPEAGLLDRVLEAVAGGGPRAGGQAQRIVREHRLAVAYDGDDLDACAAALSMSPAELVVAHQGQTWQVALMGFAPGFGYLVPEGGSVVDWGLVPRHSRPRTRVPAGSVAVAAGMSAVYPEAMPGGWQLIGRCSERLVDLGDTADPTRLHPGDLVRFVES